MENKNKAEEKTQLMPNSFLLSTTTSWSHRQIEQQQQQQEKTRERERWLDGRMDGR